MLVYHLIDGSFFIINLLFYLLFISLFSRLKVFDSILKMQFNSRISYSQAGTSLVRALVPVGISIFTCILGYFNTSLVGLFLGLNYFMKYLEWCLVPGVVLYSYLTITIIISLERMRLFFFLSSWVGDGRSSVIILCVP